MSRVLIVVAAALSASLAMLTGAASAAQTYTDPSGDSGTAADITSVNVSNDAAGKITFVLSFANRTAPTPDDVFAIFLDTDKNASTGDTRFGGADYAIFVDNGDRTVDMLRWTGTDYGDTPDSTVRTSDGRTIEVNRSELGNAAGFNFLVFAINQAGDQIDLAPNAPPPFAYDLTVAAPSVESATTTFSSTAPVAGRRFAVRSIQLHLSDQTTARPSSYTCVATLAGRTLRPVGRCAWNIPRTAKGKRLVVTVAVVFRGERGQIEPYTFRVR